HAAVRDVDEAGETTDDALLVEQPASKQRTVRVGRAGNVAPGIAREQHSVGAEERDRAARTALDLPDIALQMVQLDRAQHDAEQPAVRIGDLAHEDNRPFARPTAAPPLPPAT